MYKSKLVERKTQATNSSDFGVLDNFGRPVGAVVVLEVEIYAETETGAATYSDVAPGVYLTAKGRATRAGKLYGACTGSSKTFPVAPGVESDAIKARDAWVAEYLRAAKKRALKSFGGAV